MRTTGNQLIDSVRALLRDTVMPELQSDIARARMRQIMATLRDVDWDEAPLAVLRENMALQGLVQTLSNDAPTPQSEAAVHFEAVIAFNQELRRQIAQHFATPAAGWTAAHAEAARVLADCARQRAQKRRAPSSD